jgi:hypothetical protein
LLLTVFRIRPNRSGVHEASKGREYSVNWTADILEELEEEDDEDEDDDALNVRLPVMLGFVVTVGKYCMRACRTRERA